MILLNSDFSGMDYHRLARHHCILPQVEITRVWPCGAGLSTHHSTVDVCLMEPSYRTIVHNGLVTLLPGREACHPRSS